MSSTSEDILQANPIFLAHALIRLIVLAPCGADIDTILSLTAMPPSSASISVTTSIPLLSSLVLTLADVPMNIRTGPISSLYPTDKSIIISSFSIISKDLSDKFQILILLLFVLLVASLTISKDKRKPVIPVSFDLSSDVKCNPPLPLSPIIKSYCLKNWRF